MHFPVNLYNPCHLIFILLGYSKTFKIPKYMYTISTCIAAKFNIKFYHMVNIPATLQVFLTKWPFLQAQWRAVYPNESLADSSQRLWVIQLWHKGKSKNSEYQIILNHIKFFIFFFLFYTLCYSCTKCADFKFSWTKITIDNTQINYLQRPNTVLVHV